MTAWRWCGRRTDAPPGFTLIEALAAVAVMAALAAAVLPFANRLVERWWVGESRVQGADGWMRALVRLVDDLAEAVPISVPAGNGTRVLFRAGPRGVVLVRPSLREGASGRLEIVALMIEPSVKGDALVRYTRPFGRDLFDADPRDSAAPTLVITGAFKLAFAIIGPDGSLAEEWSDDKQLPRGVELVATASPTGPAPPAPIRLPIAARTDLARLIASRGKASKPP